MGVEMPKEKIDELWNTVDADGSGEVDYGEFATALEASGYGKIEEIGFDVFLPTYQQQPNTTFLAGTGLLDKEGRIEATSCLQSKARPEVFGAGVTNIPLLGHPASARVAAQAVTCVHNARLFLDGYEPTELAPHLDRLIPPIEPLPSIINIGHGKGAHAIWAEHTAYYPPALLCMRPCKGGFPFCPPPCCWCIAPGCLTCCGYCGGEAEGEGTAMFVESTLLPFEMRRTLGKGAGVLPPEAMEMSRLPL